MNFVSDQTHAAFCVQDGICAADVHVDGGEYNSMTHLERCCEVNLFPSRDWWFGPCRLLQRNF